jgi:hypothetical protein
LGFSGESYHKQAAKEIYEQTSKRKATKEFDMAKALSQSDVLRHIFECNNTIDHTLCRVSETEPLINKLKKSDPDAVFETKYSRHWEFASIDAIPSDCPFSRGDVKQGLNLFLKESNESIIKIGVTTSILFENSFFEKTRFATESAIRLRCDPNFRNGTNGSKPNPWYDGFMANFEVDHEGRRDKKLYISKKNISNRKYITRKCQHVRYGC